MATAVPPKENIMLWTIIVVLFVLWLLGFLGSNISPSFPRMGNGIHTLLVIIAILVVLQLMGVV
jgi:lipopolysaccharide export LptBFGC system permease protein LptF